MGPEEWGFALGLAALLYLLAPFALYVWFGLSRQPQWRGSRDVAKARLVWAVAHDRAQVRGGAWVPASYRAGLFAWPNGRGPHIRVSRLRWRYAA